MHKGILAARYEIAVKSVKESVSVLCEAAGLADLQESLNVRHQDPAVSQLFKMEAVAAVLSKLAAQNSQGGPGGGISLDQVLSVPGLSKSSAQAILKALGGE